MKFKELLEEFVKHTRKTLMSGRKHSIVHNIRLNLPIIGDDPHSKINRDRRYQRREKRLGKF